MSVRSAVGFDGGIPVGIQNLESVLATEPAGDGGNLDITNLNSLTATTINGASAVGQDLGITLTNGNTASKDIDMNTFSLTNVTSINGFTTNRNTQGGFISQQSISATVNTDFTIVLPTTITLDIGTYLANIKINLSNVTATTSYIIYLYLNDNTTDDLLTSSFIDSVSAINGVSLTIPAFPVAVTVDNSILTVRGRVNTTSSVVVAGFGDSYINCGLIFAGANPPPNPPPPPLKWSFATQSSAPAGTGNRTWKNLSPDTTGAIVWGVIFSTVGYDNPAGIYRSLDYGATWTKIVSPGAVGESCAVCNADSTYIWAGMVNDSLINRSIASGVNWNYVGINQVYNVIGIASSSLGNNIALISPSQIYTSSDAGVTITQRLTSTNFRSIASDSTGQYLVVVENGGTPYTSNDFGVTWTARSPSGSWVSVASDSTGQYLIGCMNNSGNIYLSSNYGATWTASSAGSANWSAVASNSTGNYLFACVGSGGGSGYIYTSDDSGVTWVQQNGAGSRIWTLISTNSTGDRITAVGNGYIVTGTAS